MKKFVFLLISLFALSTSYALLPPLYHTLSEIEAIISDERLAQELGSAEGITKIERVDEGYVITTFRYQLKVDVNYIPQQMIGASKFELTFHDKTPIEPMRKDNNKSYDAVEEQSECFEQ